MIELRPNPQKKKRRQRKATKKRKRSTLPRRRRQKHFVICAIARRPHSRPWYYFKTYGGREGFTHKRDEVTGFKTEHAAKQVAHRLLRRVDPRRVKALKVEKR